MNALSLACAMVVLAILAHTTLAQNSQQDYIDAHNKARAAVGVGNVSWNNTVQQYAQTYANSRKGDCQLMHSGGPYGENIYGGPIPDPSRFTGLDAMNAWLDEKQYYDYNTNSCANGHQCGHYTQVVWRNSNQIGCARVVCDNNSGIFIICNYDPPGNYPGQKPY